MWTLACPIISKIESRNVEATFFYTWTIWGPIWRDCSMVLTLIYSYTKWHEITAWWNIKENSPRLASFGYTVTKLFECVWKFIVYKNTQKHPWESSNLPLPLWHFLVLMVLKASHRKSLQGLRESERRPVAVVATIDQYCYVMLGVKNHLRSPNFNL